MPIYTLTDCASIRGVSMPTMARRIRDGRGPDRIRFGRAWAVTEQALNEWLARERAAR
jgi:predicted DNA-binding transcriptional regulator AlpA